jgi:hypothetical protein
MTPQEAARRTLLDRLFALRDEMQDELGGDTTRAIFTKLGKRPRGRPRGTRNITYKPDDPKAAERKRRAYHKDMDDIVASIATAK